MMKHQDKYYPKVNSFEIESIGYTEWKGILWEIRKEYYKPRYDIEGILGIGNALCPKDKFPLNKKEPITRWGKHRFCCKNCGYEVKHKECIDQLKQLGRDYLIKKFKNKSVD